MQHDIDTLNLLAEHGPLWAQVRARQLLEILEQREGGGLDDLDFMEIVNRMVNSPELDREADDLNVKTQLVTAAMGAANII
jgi:hypothetical protein